MSQQFGPWMPLTEEIKQQIADGTLTPVEKRKYEVLIGPDDGLAIIYEDAQGITHAATKFNFEPMVGDEIDPALPFQFADIRIFENNATKQIRIDIEV
jgi:hypothetical protein